MTEVSVADQRSIGTVSSVWVSFVDKERGRETYRYIPVRLSQKGRLCE